jgi:hypothetical protein
MKHMGAQEQGNTKEKRNIDEQQNIWRRKIVGPSCKLALFWRRVQSFFMKLPMK